MCYFSFKMFKSTDRITGREPSQWPRAAEQSLAPDLSVQTLSPGVKGVIDTDDSHFLPTNTPLCVQKPRVRRGRLRFSNPSGTEREPLPGLMASSLLWE